MRYAHNVQLGLGRRRRRSDVFDQQLPIIISGFPQPNYISFFFLGGGAGGGGGFASNPLACGAFGFSIFILFYLTRPVPHTQVDRLEFSCVSFFLSI